MQRLGPFSSWRWWKPWIRARSKRLTAGGRSAPYPPKRLAGAVVLPAMPRDFLQPQDRAGDLRTHSCPVPTGGLHPDHDSINSFRHRFLPQFERLFVQVLLIATNWGW